MKKLYKEIPIDIYKRGVLVFFGSVDDFKLYIHNYHSCYDKAIAEAENDIDGAEAISYDVNTDVIIYAEKVPTIPVLLHELSHATFFVLEQVGIDPATCTEAYTYLFEYLTKEVYNWLTLSYDVPLQLSLDAT